MKKKLTTLLAFVLVIALSVAGTYAYLTSEQTVTNTFTVGDVEILLDEAEVDLKGEYTEDHDNRTTANEYHLLPGHTYKKDPTVTVVKNSEDCYVRMLVTINKQGALNTIFAPNGLPLGQFFGGVSDDWTLTSETVKDDTRIYEFRYKEIVKKNEDKNTVLDDLFETVIVPENITGEQLETIKGLTITVKAQAIQADGFENNGGADAAWTKLPIA